MGWFTLSDRARWHSYDGDSPKDYDQVLQLEKEERKIKWAQGKGIKPKAVLFCRSRKNRVHDHV